MPARAEAALRCPTGRRLRYQVETFSPSVQPSGGYCQDMELHEAWTEDQFEEHVCSMAGEMRDANSVAYGFAAPYGFSAIIDFPTTSGEVSMVRVGYWASEAESRLGREPAWIVAACAPAAIEDLRLSLGLDPGALDRANAAADLGSVTCAGLPGAQESPVYRDASGALFSQYTGDEVAVIAVGNGALPGQQLRPVEGADLEELVQNWVRIAREARKAHI